MKTIAIVIAAILSLSVISGCSLGEPDSSTSDVQPETAPASSSQWEEPSQSSESGSSEPQPTAPQVLDSLLRHRELIPFEGVLGGTAYYYHAAVLKNNYVYAYAEDGHIGADLILSYLADADGKLSWKLVAADDHGGFQLPTSKLVSTEPSDPQPVTLSNDLYLPVGLTAEKAAEQLMNQPELIPTAALGMQSAKFSHIEILSSRYAYSYVEDGKKGTDVFFSYTVSSSGEITWSVVAFDAGNGFQLQKSTMSN